MSIQEKQELLRQATEGLRRSGPENSDITSNHTPKPMSKKPKISKAVKEAERTIAANPRYGGLTIAEATRRIMQKKPLK